MKISVLVYSAPSSRSAYSAYRYTKAALELGHSIHRLFFYHDGVLNASRLTVSPQDEFDLPLHWQKLVEKHRLDAIACISSALKRGIIDKQEASRYEKDGRSVAEPMHLSGLGQLIEAGIESDRLVSFGE